MNTKRALPVLSVLAAVPVTIGAIAGVSWASGSPQPAPAPPASVVHVTTTTEASPRSEAAPAPVATPEARRPVLRVEDTINLPTPRRVRLFDAYSTCLLQNGAEEATSGMSPDLTSSGHGILVQQPVPAAARSACRGVEPRQPAALDAATNPGFGAAAQQYVACLADHGEQVHLLNGHDLDWTWDAGQDPAAVPDDGGATEDACLIAAFG